MASDTSDRSRGVALALATVTGVFGGHRFYVGKIGTGLFQLCTLGGLGIWMLYDWILIAAGAFHDSEGKRVVNWAEYGATGPAREHEANEKLDMVLDEVDNLRAEMGELVERVDFVERMLARAKERDALPPV